MDKNIFRQDPLDKLTSPEELQERLTIVSFKNWIALSVLAVLLLCVILWSIFGKIPVLAEGKAIVFDADRITLINSEMEGTVTEISVKKGTQVAQGQELVEIENPSLEAEIREIKTLIASMEAYLKDRSADNSNQNQIEELKIQILGEKAKLENLELTKEKSKIRAPIAGNVLNIEVYKGEHVESGKVLMWLQSLPQPGQTRSIYGIIPFEEGAQIRVGMDAKIALASVPLTEYGYLLGEVKEVFPYLTPLEPGPLSMLPSEELQAYILRQKAFVIIRIDPLVDPKSPSHYQWTSNIAPPFSIQEGMLGTVKVILDVKRPISFLIPIK